MAYTECMVWEIIVLREIDDDDVAQKASYLGRGRDQEGERQKTRADNGGEYEKVHNLFV